MDDADANRGAVWTSIEFTHLVSEDLDEGVATRIMDYPLLASADSREVEVLQQGECLCGQPLAEETVILTNSGGNLAVMCSGECFDDFMMMGMLQQIQAGVANRIQARSPDNHDPD